MNSESIRKQALARCWAVVKQPCPEDDRQGLPSKTWADIPLRTRAVLVMLGAANMEDPRKVAQRPWGALSEEDRVGIAAVAREMQRDLRSSVCLF